MTIKGDKMTIQLTDLDRKILVKHSPGSRAHALLELEIVNAIIHRAAEYDYRLQVEGEEEVPTLKHIVEMVFNLGIATLLVFDRDKNIGWISLVFGNGGYDLISDYSTNLESFLKPVNEMAAFWG